ncbi:hypothetical protein IKE88_02885 [Candidatus Saccharibacteria bacterium]|nr:hypothetical protein [Candidatus Saccharibacteria bacterium]
MLISQETSSEELKEKMLEAINHVPVVRMEYPENTNGFKDDDGQFQYWIDKVCGNHE